MNTSNRRLDLDWIRIAAFGLLITYHVGMYYVSWDWHIKSPHASETLEPLMMAMNPWRLSLLFFVSGCAMAFMLRGVPGERLAPVAWHRTWFLLVPVIFAMVVIVPPQSYYEVVEKLGYGDSYMDFWRRYLARDQTFYPGGKHLVLPTWNHLWFVVYLWVYTVLLVGLKRFAPAAGSRFAVWFRGGLTGCRVLVLPWIVLALARVFLFPRFGSTHALVDDLYNHVMYGTVFAIGYVLAREEAVWAWLAQRRWIFLGMAGVSYAEFMVYAFSFSDASPPPEALRMFERVVYALLQWTALLAVLAWGVRLLRNVADTPARRYLSGAVFCYYVVHQTAIILVARALLPFDLPVAVEGPLLVLATVAICAASFELVRRVPGVRVLFGIRAPAR